jgi:hypothetical protein
MVQRSKSGATIACRKDISIEVPALLLVKWSIWKESLWFFDRIEFPRM